MAKKYSNKKRLDIFNKNNGRCIMCNIELILKDDTYNYAGRYMHIDHFIPQSKNGTNDISNLFPICLSCNSKKGTWTVESATVKIETVKQEAIKEVAKREELLESLKAYERKVLCSCI